jgi:adenosyl cobinamide kinase/adenosyl cobinamide phosphate guanylyltransferase
VLTLVLGGIRSGKSGFAVDLARKAGGRVAVVATGTASDEEMRQRIELHGRSRPAEWAVYEDGFAGVVPHGSADTILLDSVDGWLGAGADPEGCIREVRALCQRASQVIAVSGEVGLSLVALTPSGRAFTDALGTVNQQLAADAEAVYLVVAGLPIALKGSGP